MWTRASGSTRWIALAVWTPLAAGCMTAPSSNAICDATKDSRTAHAGALYEDGGPKSVMTGAYLIAQIDVGCAK
jgi:hypothetical protein